jgi:hypothetical protein
MGKVKKSLQLYGCSSLALDHLATYTDFGLGACGFYNTNSQLVVGVSTSFFNHFP